jgi:inorganic triphosphatase YgiF
MSEIELKFLVGEAGIAAVLKRAGALAVTKPSRRKVESTYYDTAARDLRQQGLTLRLRRDGRKWLQTVKADGRLAGGLSRVTEDEAALPEGKLSLEAIGDAELRRRIVESVDVAALNPLYSTAIERTRVELEADGARAELALDAGRIVAGDQEAPLHEMEIELLEGEPKGLYAIARELLPVEGFRFSRLSKAARADLLIETGRIEPPPAPRRAFTVALAAGRTTEQAAHDVLHECLDQIADNITAVLATDDAEGPHQLRIGLRRFRSALTLFRPALAGEEAERLADEAKWLGRKVGKLRDLEVARDDLAVPYAASHPDETGFQPLIAALGEKGREARTRLRECLEDRRTQLFLLDLSAFIETRGWLRPEDFGQTEELARPLKKQARKALDKRFEEAGARAKNIARLGGEERHELRKELKKLRYAAEFLGPVFGAKKSKPFLRKLKRVQNVFGEMNDAVMARHVFAPETLPTENPDAARAGGMLIGALEARAESRWKDATALWEELRDSKRFWK